MANRYNYSKIIRTSETKKNYLESTIYPKIKATDNDLYIISTQGDRLDLLASQYYSDRNLWWVIAVANNLNDASLSIEPGKQLRIPGNISNILSDLQKVNK
jgi:hypothetical protein